ncbi:MAG: DUF1570 domain-containing protein [Planctomycetota bacterium]
MKMQIQMMPQRRCLRVISCFAMCLVFMVLVSPSIADHLTLEIDGKTYDLDGEILIEAQDSSLYFRENNGKIWFVQPDQIKIKEDTDDEVAPISKKELGEKLLAELPEGFRIYETKHYVIAYQNEIAYARWIGNLYEVRLFKGFEAYWKRRKKFKLTETEFPLVAIIFGNKAEYQRHVDRELGPGQNMVAYYNVQNNRVTMYDLTADNVPVGVELNDRKIEQVLQNPAAINMVATVIHEGTHQLLFNRGIQTRFADCPLWVNEGLAMYFEAPDLQSKRGWQKPGLIFQQRLLRFIDYVKRRPADSLETLISEDNRLRQQDSALDAYAEAWALNHFLLTRRSKDYVKYLEHLAAKKPLEIDTKEQRLSEFKDYFGDDLVKLDREFLSYISRLR